MWSFFSFCLETLKDVARVVIIDIALYAVIAQVVERIHGKDEVVGSSPPIGTMNSKEKLI
jgi:hypothetical protein